MKKAPEKRVGEANCTWEQAAAASKEKPFGIRQGQEFQYMIRAEVTPNRLKSFVVQDILGGLSYYRGCIKSQYCE